MRLAATLVLLTLSTSAAAQLSAIRAEPMRPQSWAPSDADECSSHRRARGAAVRERFCDGPRRVPEPEGEAAARASRLELGTHRAADRLFVGRAPSDWLDELPSSSRRDMLWPVARGLFSRGFGYVRRQAIRHRRHNGVDIVAEAGAHIRAVNDGLVVYADNGVRGYGNLLVLLHADGSGTFYAHCRAIYVTPGQLVARGQTVAEVGNTGRPIRAHLHFEWRRHGRPLDPIRRFVEKPSQRAIRPDPDTRDFAPPPPNLRGRTVPSLRGRSVPERPEADR